MGTLSPGQRKWWLPRPTAPWWPGSAPRLSIFRLLIIALVALTTVYIVSDVGLLVPPGVTRQFLDPPKRVVLSRATLGGRSEYFNQERSSLQSLFNQVRGGRGTGGGRERHWSLH